MVSQRVYGFIIQQVVTNTFIGRATSDEYSVQNKTGEYKKDKSHNTKLQACIVNVMDTIADKK